MGGCPGEEISAISAAFAGSLPVVDPSNFEDTALQLIRDRLKREHSASCQSYLSFGASAKWTRYESYKDAVPVFVLKSKGNGGSGSVLAAGRVRSHFCTVV